MNDALGTPSRVLLLGGTSEIGLATVRRVLRGRHGAIVLAARPSERREDAAAELREAGHSVLELDFDAARTDEHDTILDRAFADGDVDLAIVAFGQLGDQERSFHDPDLAIQLAQVNYVGAVSIGLGLRARMRPQGHGAILALSSVAAERPRRSNFVYGSTKAGFDAFFSGLADELHGSGVTVSVLRAGFVHTRMTAAMRPAPLATDATSVAEAAAEVLRSRRPIAWVPWPLRLVMAVLRHLPRALFRRLDL